MLWERILADANHLPDLEEIMKTLLYDGSSVWPRTLRWLGIVYCDVLFGHRKPGPILPLPAEFRLEMYCGRCRRFLCSFTSVSNAAPTTTTLVQHSWLNLA